MSQEYEHNSSSLESSFYSDGSVSRQEEGSIDDALFDRKEDDFARIDDIGQRRKGSFLSLLLLLVIAGGVLWTMRMLDERAVEQAKASDSNRVEIDQLVAKFKQKMADLDKVSGGQQAALSETDRVLAIFRADLSDRQVGLADLYKNPFQARVQAPAANELNDEPTPEILAKLGLIEQGEEEVIEEEVDPQEEVLETLQLGSLLVGKTSLAVINGRAVRVGQAVGPFTVKEISARGVVLAADGKTYELKRAKDETE